MGASVLPVALQPNLHSVKRIGNITNHQEGIREQHLQALKYFMAKRKCAIEEEGKAKEE